MAGKRRDGSGTTRQLPSGRWQARYRDEDGTRHAAPITFDTKMDALAWLRVNMSGDRVEPAPVDSMETVATYGRQWLDKREIEARTREGYERDFATICKALGNVRLTRLSVLQVQAWYDSLNPDTPVQRAHLYSLLRTIMRSAQRQGLTPTQPCIVEGGGSAKTRHKVEPVTVDQLVAIAAALPAQYRALVYLTTYQSLRFGEATELRRSDVDLAAGTIAVRRGVVRLTGAPRLVKRPKNDAGYRTLAMPSFLVPILREHLDAFVGPSPSALLFPSAKDPDKNLPASTLDWQFRQARIAAGRPDLHFHDLRHTGATWAAMDGATLAELMQRVGHSTESAAMRYQHATKEADARIAASLNRFAPPAGLRLAGDGGA